MLQEAHSPRRTQRNKALCAVRMERLRDGLMQLPYFTNRETKSRKLWDLSKDARWVSIRARARCQVCRGPPELLASGSRRGGEGSPPVLVQEELLGA